MSRRRRWEDGTTGRPLGDDEDLDPGEYGFVDEPEVDRPDAADLAGLGDWLWTRDRRTA